MNPGRRRCRRVGPRLIAVVGVATLLMTACGARLTRNQVTALSRPNQPAAASEAGAAGGTLPDPASAPTGASAGGLASGGGIAAGTRPGATTTVLAGGAGAVISARPGPAVSGGSVTSAGPNPLLGPNGRTCAAGAISHDPGVTPAQITLGNIATINGPIPGLFVGARYGADAVADYINSMGGLCGRRLAVESVDDNFDQATDQADAGQLANHVFALVGSFSLQDSGIPAAAPGVPDIGDAVSPQRFTSVTNFSPQPNPPGYDVGPFEYLKSNPKYAAATQHMALLVEATPQTQVTGQWMAAGLKSIGYKFVFTDTSLQPTDPTFNGDVSRMKADGVEGVMFQASGTIIGQLANAMYAAGMNIVIGNYSAGAYDPGYIQSAGPGAQGTILDQSLALFDGQDAASVPMVATFDQWYSRVDPGNQPSIDAAYAWMSGLLLAEAVNQGGAPTRQAVLAGLTQITDFTAGDLQPPANPAGKVPPSCWLLIDVVKNQFARDPATATGFKCSPAAYYYYKT